MKSINKLIKYNENISKLYYKNICPKDNNLIVVTSINPTSFGEGKTTSLIGLVDLFNDNKLKAIGCLRQPSIGPYLGLKGGATGSGKCKLNNEKIINLGLTGDFEKIALVNNLIVSILENEIFHNSELNIDEETIFLKRCIDLNDRSLRNINYQINDKINIKTGFVITAASDLMALFCLCENKQDFIEKLSNSIVARSKNNKPIYLKDLKLEKIILDILDSAFFPTVVKTFYGNDILIHGGPFANIAHGCNSIIATKLGLSKYKYTFVECGFGSDLGLEKFINIKCKRANLKPNLVVYVVSLKSLMLHGKNDINEAINYLKKHLSISESFNLPHVVIINKFKGDNINDLKKFKLKCLENNIMCEISTMWFNGPKNNKHILNLIKNNLEKNINLNFSYESNDSLKEKIEKIARKIYKADSIIYSNNFMLKLNKLNLSDIKTFDICIAKNQSTIIGHKNDDNNFYVNDLFINYFAKLIIIVSSEIFLMPGLPIKPNAKSS